MSTKLQVDLSSSDDSDTFSDSVDDSNPKRLRLKPSKVQQEYNKKTKIPNDVDSAEHLDNVDDENEDCVSLQSNVLSQYLKPTNILSKYQNNPNSNEQHELEENEEEEEEEKEWPTIEDVEDIADIEFVEDAKTSDFELISFNDLCIYLIQEAQDKIDCDDIIIEDFRNISWFSYIKLYVFGGCKISLKSNKLNEERDAIFKIGKLKLDIKNIKHAEFMITLWMKLTNNECECDKTGSHWQQIGFQGNDPSTDIRGSGLLGILQIFYIIHTYNHLITKIYLLSIDQNQNFPLIIVSFKITQIVIQLLRSCLIYNEINKNKSVIFTINEIYVALFYQFYLKWKNNIRTIIDFDKTYKELRKDAFKNWQGLLQQLLSHKDSM